MKTALKTPVGNILITEKDGFISELELNSTQKPSAPPSPLLREAARQIEEYFLKKRRKFDLPVNPDGTIFQKAVWREMQKIRFGKTASYKNIAEAVGNPRAFRAVGGAANKNPIALIIPCHRVVGADGSLTGFAGGMALKKKLLDFEKSDKTR